MLTDDIAAALPELRAQAESLMVDTCAITRPGGRGEYDPDTHTYGAATDTTVYTGACRVRADLDPGDVDFGGGPVTLTTALVSIPIDADQVLQGDTVTITAAVNDPQLVGRTFTVRAVLAQTHATARRLRCEEST